MSLLLQKCNPCSEVSKQVSNPLVSNKALFETQLTESIKFHKIVEKWLCIETKISMVVDTAKISPRLLDHIKRIN